MAIQVETVREIPTLHVVQRPKPDLLWSNCNEWRKKKSIKHFSIEIDFRWRHVYWFSIDWSIDLMQSDRRKKLLSIVAVSAREWPLHRPNDRPAITPKMTKQLILQIFSCTHISLSWISWSIDFLLNRLAPSVCQFSALGTCFSAGNDRQTDKHMHACVCV